MTTLPDTLRSSEGFQALAQAFPDAVLVVRPGGEVVYASEEVGGLMGIEGGGLVGHVFLDLVAPSDRAAFPEPFASTAIGTWDFRPACEPDRWLNAAVVPPGLHGRTADSLHPELGECSLVFIRDLPPRSQARDRTDLFRHALDAANNLIVVTDATAKDNPMVFVNEYFLEVTGYTREEVIGQNCRFLQMRADGTRDDDQEGVRELSRAIAARESTQVVIRNYRKSGELFYNELFITPVFDGDGRVVNYVGVQNDVTQRVDAQQDASAQAGLLEAFFESSPLMLGVVERDAEGLVHRAANERAAEILGCPADEVPGKHHTDLGFSDAEAARWIAAIDECAASGEASTFETVHPWDSNPQEPGVRYLRVTVSPVGGQTGMQALFSYIAEDTTDNRETERQRRILSAAVEQAAEAIVVTDADIESPGPVIVYANRAHQRIFGYDPGEVMGQSPRIFQGPATDRVVLDRIRAALEAGEPAESETINYRKDGTPFVLSWEIAPVRDAEGRVVNWVGTQRDVTERRRLEREILEVATAEQERMARDLHDGLGQILTGASFMIEALRTSLDRAGDATRVADAARAGELVREALDQARAIARGLSPIDVEPTGLMTALDGLVEDASSAHGIQATLEYDTPALVRSREAAADLYRIAQEALSNAARHGKAESVTIRITHRGSFVTVAIEDDGTGLPPDAAKGRGLGLRTMAARALRIGGTLDVGPRPGGGTRVAISFPRAYEVAGEEPDLDATDGDVRAAAEATEDAA